MLKLDDINFLKGNFLLATPVILDDRFRKSLIFMCDVKDSNAFGLIVNFATQEKSKKLENTVFEDMPVYNGGPVDQERIFLLHSNDCSWKQTLKISDEIFITNMKDVLKNTNTIPSKFLIIKGYANWQDGQLEREMSMGFWLTYKTNASIIFDIADKNKWKYCITQLHLDENTYATYIGNS